MRGKEISTRAVDCITGITPAYAGKRKELCLRTSRVRDHPRVCGEKGKVACFQLCEQGSPPRMRGKAETYNRREVWKRITPAYAGKRGGFLPHALKIWITPAYAGKSHFSFLWRFLWRDHPRVCGEKNTCQTQPIRGQGSPPRMRGKVAGTIGTVANTGITPAYAGKSIHPLCPPMLYRDHPRVCGEKTICGEWPQTSGGSPPRMRGKVSSKRPNAHSPGITPAYAGKS